LLYLLPFSQDFEGQTMSQAMSVAEVRQQASSARHPHRKIQWHAYLFLLPAFTLFAVFVAYPVLFNAVLSFQKWNGLAPSTQSIGLENYQRLLNDRVVGISLRNSAIFVAGHLITMGLGLVLAVLLNNPYPGRSVIRTLLFLPAVLASTIIAVTWSTIYEANLGALNVLLRNLGLKALAQDWLGNPQIAIFALTAVGIWAGIGFPMVVYLASLQSINTEINDAALVDGANPRQLFRFITFPLLRNTHLILLLLGVIASVQAFDVPNVLTAGGPFNATSTLTIYIYKNVFTFSDFGYGAALGQFTLVILLLLTGLQRLFLRERDTG
jgi:raffinose/stachyose/melibiose transport system permease protein